MPIENPDIIQLGSLIKDDTQLGDSPFTTQTGMDIGADESQPGSTEESKAPPLPPALKTITARDAEKERVKMGIIAFIGGILSGVFIGSIITMGRRRR